MYDAWRPVLYKFRVDFMSVETQKPKAEKLLKTKDREGHFPAAKAENMLKTRQLLKGAGTRNSDDILSSYEASLCRRGEGFQLMIPHKQICALPGKTAESYVRINSAGLRRAQLGDRKTQSSALRHPGGVRTPSKDSLEPAHRPHLRFELCAGWRQ